MGNDSTAVIFICLFILEDKKKTLLLIIEIISKVLLVEKP